jgi:hypothetical protein
MHHGEARQVAIMREVVAASPGHGYPCRLIRGSGVERRCLHRTIQAVLRCHALHQVEEPWRRGWRDNYAAHEACDIDRNIEPSTRLLACVLRQSAVR